MRSRSLFAGLAVSSAAIFSLGASGTVQAQVTTPSTFNIASWGTYCANGSPSCSTYGGQYRYADAEGFGAPGASSGTPQNVYAECDNYYTNASGQRIDAYELVNSFYETSSSYPGYSADQVRVYGTGALGMNPTETNTAATGRLTYIAHDYQTGDTATVSGSQITDNVYDTFSAGNHGGFTITLHGPIYNGNTGLQIGTGTITCTTARLSSVYAAENEFEPFDPSDNEPN